MEEEISERTHHARKTFPAAAWWREDVEVPSVPLHGRSAVAEPPPRELHQEVLRRIADSFAAIKGPIDDLMTRHRRYADATGDVFYLVRTACNVGMRLIKKGPPSEKLVRGESAVRLARLAFDYDPTNVYAWALLQDGLETEGRLDDAEMVGWEAIRRFPENPQWRSQLSTLLANSLGRPEEAATLLKESVALFPGDIHSRNQLAIVLADDLDQSGEAKKVLEAARHDSVADEATLGLLEKLKWKKQLRAISRQRHILATDALRPGALLNLPTAEARRALFRFENGLADIASVRTLLNQEAPDAYLCYVGERTGTQSPPLKTTFALAFEAAARSSSVTALQALLIRSRPLEGVLITQAIAAIEARIEAVPANDNEGGSFEHVIQLTRHFAGRHAPAPEQRLILLRDTAASFLSTDVLRLVPTAELSLVA